VDERGVMSVTPERRHAWRLVQIADLLRRSHALHVEALDRIERLEIDAELASDVPPTLGDDVTAELERLGEGIVDLVGQLQVLTRGLPDEDVKVGLEDVRTDAAVDLAAGIYDEARALLAARVLSADTGWPALAEALRSTDAHWGWETVTVERLLGSFREVGPDEVTATLAAAGIDAPLEFAACTTGQALGLASVLDRRKVA
jgi:hypothetical protein